MKNRPHHTRYKPGQAGKSPLQVCIGADPQGYWYGTVWRRGPLTCLWSTGRQADQREVHTMVQQWLREQGYHKQPLGR